MWFNCFCYESSPQQAVGYPDKMNKSLQLRVLILIGLFVAAAFAGCIGGDDTGDDPGDDVVDAGDDVKDDSGEDVNSTVPLEPRTVEFYFTPTVLADNNLEEPPVPELPIPVSKEYETVLVKPESGTAALGTAVGVFGYDTLWSFKATEGMNIKGTTKFHLWISYTGPNAPVEVDVRMYKNYEEISSAYWSEPAPVSPGVVQYEIDLSAKTKLAAGDVLSFGVIVFGMNVNQGSMVDMVCGGDTASGVTLTYTPIV